MGLSSSKLGTACAHFGDGSVSCWGQYESQDGGISHWWPYRAFKIFDPQCETLPLRWYPRLTVPGGLLGVSTDPMQILGVSASYQVGAVLSPRLSGLADGLVAGMVSGSGLEKVEGWPEGSLAPEGLRRGRNRMVG